MQHHDINIDFNKMLIGDTIICVDNKIIVWNGYDSIENVVQIYPQPLTKSKKYVIVNINYPDNIIKVVNDKGYECFYTNKLFKSLSEERERKLKNLLND